MKSSTILILSALLAATACAPTPADSAPKSVAAAPAKAATQPAAPAAAPASNSVYDLEATSIDGGKVSMGDYKGKVTLIVNVASRCGYTGQYAGLQKLHTEMADKGFDNFVAAEVEARGFDQKTPLHHQCPTPALS